MKRYLTVPLYVLLVFLSGVMVGAVSYRLYNARSVTATVQPKMKPDEWRKHVVEEMRTRLQLDPAQVDKLQAAFDATHERFTAYDQRSKAERKAIVEDQHQTIRAFLNDQQRAEYDKYLLERQQKRKNDTQKKQHGGS